MLSKFLPVLLTGMFVSFAAHGNTVGDCIEVFEDYKKIYAKSVSKKTVVNCTRTDTSIKLYAIAIPPFSCIDEDEWNLDVRAVAGIEGMCSMRIRGSPGPECGAEKVVYQLEEEDAEKWVEFVGKQCDEMSEKQ